MPEAAWAALEQGLVPPAATMVVPTWLDAPARGGSHESVVATNPCVAGETVGVEVEVWNPLAIAVQLSDVHLTCVHSAASSSASAAPSGAAGAASVAAGAHAGGSLHPSHPSTGNAASGTAGATSPPVRATSAAATTVSATSSSAAADAEALSSPLSRFASEGSELRANPPSSTPGGQAAALAGFALASIRPAHRDEGGGGRPISGEAQDEGAQCTAEFECPTMTSGAQSCAGTPILYEILHSFLLPRLFSLSPSPSPLPILLPGMTKAASSPQLGAVPGGSKGLAGDGLDLTATDKE